MKVVSALAFVALAAFGAAAESFEIDRIGEIRCEGERLVRASGGNGKDVRLDSAKPIRVIEAFQSGVSSVTVGDAEEAERLGRKIGNIYAKRSYPPRHTNTVWKLAEEFRFTNALDRSLWKQFAHHPWQQKRPETIITNEDLAYVGGGVLHLVGALNPKIDDLYSYPCRCGRVKTEGTLNIHYGKVEIDVKMEDQKGSLFALWMMPQERVGTWPLCGEIDIIERLNDEEAVWQTEHNYRADKLSINQNPRNHAHPAVKTREWTTYGLEWYPDELVWTVNGKPTHRYPKISDHQEDWPWTNPQYLRMEMIMENKEWAGPFDPATLPCEARIRSVRFYTGEIDGKPFGKVYRLDGPRD